MNKDKMISLYEVCLVCYLCQNYHDKSCYGSERMCDYFELKEDTKPEDYVIDSVSFYTICPAK